MEKTSPKFRYLVRIWHTGTFQPGRSYPFTDEQEARDAYDLALTVYDADVFTLQLFDNAGVGELARH
jgi:hypothetical protein